MKCLFVDDDRNILNAFNRQLESTYSILAAPSAQEALAVVEMHDDIAVVISDLKMPVMDGLTLLQEIKKRSPSTTRILLTGFPDLQAAMRAVNQGLASKFLTKPCSVEEVTVAIGEGMEAYSKGRSEAELLERTLSACLKLLNEIMMTVDPLGVEQLDLIRTAARKIGAQVSYDNLSEVELAASLSEIGVHILPTPVLIKLRTNQVLSPPEQKALERIPAEGAKLISQIPRLERIAQILKEATEESDGIAVSTPVTGAHILRVARDFAALRHRGLPFEAARDALLKTRSCYHPKALRGLTEIIPELQREIESSRRVTTEELTPGQTVANDIVTTDGVLLVPAGTFLSPELVARVRNYARIAGLKEEPLILDNGRRSSNSDGQNEPASRD